MKKSYLITTFFLTFITATFGAEPRISLIKNTQCPEDYAHNFLWCLENPWYSSRHFFDEFIEYSVTYATEGKKRQSSWFYGRSIEFLRYFFVTPSDPVRMNALKKQLQEWITSHKHLNRNPDKFLRAKGFKLLKSTVRNEAEITKIVLAQEEERLKEEALQAEQDAEDLYDSGIKWHLCTIL